MFAGITGALVWGGFFRVTEPELGTLLSSVDVQLRLAAQMPGQSEPRLELVRSATEVLDSIAADDQHVAIVVEYKGYAAYLGGSFGRAAEYYADAAGRPDADRPALLVRAARMELLGKRPEQALRRLDELPRSSSAAAVARAEALIDLERNEDALAVADALANQTAAENQPWLELGSLFERLRKVDAAEAAYTKAAAQNDIANYFLGRLKARQGQIDSSIDCLERAAAANAAWVRAHLDRDASAWAACRSDQRYQVVRGTHDAAARPGR